MCECLSGKVALCVPPGFRRHFVRECKSVCDGVNVVRREDLELDVFSFCQKWDL